MTTFISKLEARWQQNLFVSVGLDSDFSKIPPFLKDKHQNDFTEIVFDFNKRIVDATHDLVCAYKPNTAFYEAYGVDGWQALQKTTHYLKENYPQIPIILDAKRADIGNTNQGYVHMAFENLKVDAITVHPYLGKEALQPFLDQKEKGIIVLVKTSNPGSGEFQNLQVGSTSQPLYQLIAQKIKDDWNSNQNCALVVGATYPQELVEVRKIVGDMPILIPGIGAQGGDLAATIKAGQDSRGWGMIINSSRSIIFASQKEDFAQQARFKVLELNSEITKYLKK